MSGEIIQRIEAPRANVDLIGHELAEAFMQEAWRSGRLAHSWLIGGPIGVGKATLAWRFARFVLAGGIMPEPSQPLFRQIAAGAHPDCRLITRGYDTRRSPPRIRSEIAVDDVRALGRFLHQTSVMGGWRVVIVDAADEMSLQAANALLKLLEEPPSRSLLMLVAHAPTNLLPTLRSRCQKVLLRPLTEEQVVTLLNSKLPELDTAERKSLAQLADGCPGRAIELGTVGALDLYRELIEMLKPLPDLDVGTVHEAADRFGRGASGEVAFRTMSGLLWRWLTVMIRGSACGASPVEVIPGEVAMMTRLAERGGLDRWLVAWEKTGDLFARTEKLNLDRRQVFLNVILALAETARG